MVQSKTNARLITRGVIKALALGGGIGLVIVAPNSLTILDTVMKKTGKTKSAKTLSYLKYRKLVELKGKNGDHYYRLTDKGWAFFKKIQIDELAIPTPKRWDKNWRLVMFDIPLSHQKQRQYFLRQLRSLDFYMLQRSAWIHPFECKEQIGILLSHLGIERFATYIVIKDGNFTEHAITHFKKIKLLL